MIANLVIVVFILAMAYIWSVYGFFSAFLQLVLVVAAGALALALWEPVAIGMGLLDRLGQPGWGVALLGPFVLLLILFRTVCDVLVRKNVHFPRLAHTLGGAACGLISGIIIAGMTWVGLNFLPLGPSVAGIQPYYRANNGQVIESEDGGKLWFGVDHFVVAFYSGLSRGAFSSSTPLARYQPDLAYQAATFRLHTDDNASIIARPSGVTVETVYSQPGGMAGLDMQAAEALGPAGANAGNRLVILDTLWTQEPGTYDQDSAVRVAPNQVQLVAWDNTDRRSQPQRFTPLAFSRISDFQTNERTFVPLDTDIADARSNQQSDTFGFVFILPAKLDPQYVLIRHLRVSLPQINTDSEAFKLALGEPAAEPIVLDTEAEPDGPPTLGPREGGNTGAFARDIELTNQLPKAFSRNFASGLSYEGSAIKSGDAKVNQAASGLSKNTRVDSVYVPSHQSAVRVMLTAEKARSIFGRALSSARALQGVWLIDERNQQWFPIGYSWYRGGNDQAVNVDPFSPIRSAKQLPISEMSGNDELYLYFAVPKGTSIVSYNVGETSQAIEPPLKTK